MPKPPDFWQDFGQWLKTDNAVPLLLTGSVQTDWNKVLTQAKTLAVCTNKQERPCLVCRSCKQALADYHPDILTLKSENNSYKVKSVRALLNQLSSTTLTGTRLVIIASAELLAPTAGNTLLKVLEDSNSANHWLLTTSYRSRLLPTILSRCQTRRLSLDLAEKEDEPVPGRDIQYYQGLSRGVLDEQDLKKISEELLNLIKSGQSDVNVQRALLRLRDYHKIASLKGNTKLASDVLLASLTQLPNTLTKQ